jgi:DNA-binding CsgD family transcriptional regulator
VRLRDKPDLTVLGHGPLVGRQLELKTLESALDALSHRRTSYLALSGAPGVGKSRLLTELAGAAARRGYLVLGGGATELEREMPFGVWVDALDDYVRSIGSDGLQRLVGERVSELARVLPSVRAAGRQQEPVLGDERFRAHRAVGFLLERLAAQRPVVVVLDDLHRADDASLELVAHLLRRPVGASMVFALAFRTGQLPAWMAVPLHAAARDGLMRAIAMQPLTAAETDALLSDQLGATVRTRLYELTGGNPFYLEQLARLAVRDRAAFLAAGDLTAVPDAVAAGLGDQVAELGEDARLLAWGAAVMGEPVDLELAAATAAIDLDRALDAIDELLRAQLLEPTAVPCRYRFLHPIVRCAVYESAAEGWRMRAHARAAEALSCRRASASARAHHVERSARAGDEQAIAVLVEAGSEAAARAPAAAARWYAAALRLLPQDRSALQRRLELLIAVSSALVAAGQLEQGLDALLEAIGLVPRASGAIRVRLVAACAGCENLLGRHDAGHERLLRALEELDDHGSPDAAALQVELAADAIFHTDFVATRDWAESAHATARAHGDRGLTAVAAALACFANYALGRPQPADRARVEAVTALDAIPDDALAGRLDAPYYLGYAEYFCERYDDAIRHLQRAIAVSRAAGQGQFIVPTMVGLAFALEVRGRLPEAIDMAESAVEAARLAGNHQLTGFALVVEAWTAAICGNVEQTLRAGEEALASIEGLDESVLTRANRETVAAAFIVAGDPERGLQVAQLAGAPDFRHVDPGRRAWLYALLAQAELALGRRAAAEDWLARGERTTQGLDLSLRTAEVLHARALLLLAADDPDEAAHAGRDAMQRADSVGAVVQSARSRTLLGAALGRCGKPEEGVALLRQAEAQLASYGARRARAEAVRELRRLGRRPATPQRRGAGGQGLDALSGREREIAELVAHGHTNRTIATQLYLSEKTVESHLAKVFVKLRVRSRAEVAERIGRARPTP